MNGTMLKIEKCLTKSKKKYSSLKKTFRFIKIYIDTLIKRYKTKYFSQSKTKQIKTHNKSNGTRTKLLRNLFNQLLLKDSGEISSKFKRK